MVRVMNVEAARRSVVPVVVVAVVMAVLVATMASMSHHDEQAIHELQVHV